VADRKSQNARSKKITPSSAVDAGLRRPEVIVEFVFDRGLLFVSVNNISDRPATRVSVKFNHEITGLNGTKSISALPMFRNIEFLGPRREVMTLLDGSESYFRRKQPTKISVRISYSDSENQKYEATINHDLEIYRDIHYVTSPGANNTSAEVIS
jgi:hypothetical protein